MIKKNFSKIGFMVLLMAISTTSLSISAQETLPIDRTNYIKNPSFETNGVTNWLVSNMSTQNNSVFSIKDGSYYVETWVSSGQKIADASISQTIKNLPQGNYTLKANALHIQQSGSNSTTNKGDEQTGVYLFAGQAKTLVTSMKEYIVSFSIIENKGNINIGLSAENATGNYLCVDHFRLQYNGPININDYATEISLLIKLGDEYLEKGIQKSVAETLNAAIDTGNSALQGTDTDDEGNPIYDLTSLSEAHSKLLNALELAKESRALYDDLQERIDYAQKVIKWWENEEHKASAVERLKTGIETAQQKVTNYSLSTSLLNMATRTLNTQIAAVDKKIYCSGNACGTEEQLNLSASHWSFERSLQSKHWIIFWESGYGTNVPASVESILNSADQVFEHYANELKFININQGSSKADTYKMIIRLRYTDEWEASGSGIDNTIGLLTLSRWAYTSRGGQTVAHEIGHCFQYQVHCDNKDWNGWMYNWGRGNYNVFWEMCAQWQAYKFYPHMQFDNEWLSTTLNGQHKHPLAVDLRYNNYFIQDYFCHKHGMDIIGRLWNESKSPEDPLQAYMRLTMDENLSEAEKLDQLNNEMWEFGARMTTFDMDPIRTQGAGTIGKRNQTQITKDNKGFWSPTAADCIENFGHNAIRLNAPATEKTIYAEFVGEVGKSGYSAYNTRSAGWKIGFVALKRDGTRIYGPIATATYDNPEVTVSFDCPAMCSYVWLVVSGAPTTYWTRDWIDWDGKEGDIEQWPYKVKLHQTNVFGNSSNNTLPSTINEIEANNGVPSDNNVYSITGQILRRGSTSLEGLPHGIYIVNEKKIVK